MSEISRRPDNLSLEHKTAKRKNLYNQALSMQESSEKINRKELVERHHIRWQKPDGVLPVGNGEFCFGADVTGLQTFAGFTMAHWGWHSYPLPEGLEAKDIPSTGTFMEGVNEIPEEIADDRPEVARWMFDNPHRMKLARIRFCHQDGKTLLPSEISESDRKLDIWRGIHSASFSFGEDEVKVTTIVHPSRDLVIIRASSEAFKDNSLRIAVDFEYPTLNDIDTRKPTEDPEGLHNTKILDRQDCQMTLERVLDEEMVNVAFEWGEQCELIQSEEHRFFLDSKGSSSLELRCEFNHKPISLPLPSAETSQTVCEEHWRSFWNSGGAIDLSSSRDPRWKELERRVVLSQYNMAAQSAGSWPSAEIGLMGIDAWRGQFHMEMIWWHLAHYSLWGRLHMAERALGCYQTFLSNAKALAKQLGYKGAMWPKSVGPEGRSATWGGNTALLWKQPHPIFFAELEYRQKPTRSTLEKWSEIIDETAEHMASYPVWDEERQCASLIPCILPSETGKTRDGVFDLVYWRWGLEMAQTWRERMGKNRISHWDTINSQLAPLPIQEGIYVRTDEPGTRHNQKNYSHPDSVGIFGMLPLTEGVNPKICKPTVKHVWETWEWDRCWGWDFPWTAMAAAKTGQQNLAVDILLAEAGYRNAYDETGLNRGGSHYYLPGNGGLLYAVAMMAAGWDDCEDEIHAPGFPQDGSWTVRCEGLSPAL